VGPHKEQDPTHQSGGDPDPAYSIDEGLETQTADFSSKEGQLQDEIREGGHRNGEGEPQVLQGHKESQGKNNIYHDRPIRTLNRRPSILEREESVSGDTDTGDPWQP